MTKLSVVCIHRMVRAGRDVRTGSDMGSDQVAQGFIQSRLENLQGQRLNNVSGKGALCRSVLGVTCPASYSQSDPLLFHLTCVDSCPPIERCCAEPSSIFPVIPSGVGGMLLSGHPEAVPPGWTSPDPSASPHGTSAPDPSRHGGRSAELTPVCQGCPCLRWEPERGPGIQMCSLECRVTSTNLSFYQKTKQVDEALNLVNMTLGRYWFNIDFSKLWGSKISGPALCITK